MSVHRYMTTASWPSAPDIRGRDLAWIAILGLAGLTILLGIAAILASPGFGPQVPDGAPAFDTWPDRNVGDFWALYLMIGAFYGYMALVVHAILVRPQRQNWRDLGFRQFNVKWLAAAVALGAALFVSGEWLTGLLQLKEQAESYHRGLFVPENANVVTATVQILLIGPATAVIEEVCFRGLLHRWLRQMLSRLPGLALSAAIFAIAHLGFVDPGGVLGWYWTAEVFVFGAVLALLFEWSGSLWPPIILHASNNVAAVALAYLGA